MLSSLNLHQVSAPGYIWIMQTETEDSKSGYLGRWETNAAKIWPEFFSTLALVISRNCYPGSPCPPDRITLKKKTKTCWLSFWDYIISSFLFPPPDPPICASLLSIKLMASFDLNCCYICVCVAVCIHIYLNNTSRTFSEQVKRRLFEERPQTQKTEIEKIRRGNWARLDDCGRRSHSYPHILP